jgi:hypothetical protein
MERLHILIRRAINRHRSHPGAARRFTDPLGITPIGFIALHIRLHGLWGHEFHGVPQLGDFPRPVVGAATGFQAHQPWRQLRQQG